MVALVLDEANRTWAAKRVLVEDAFIGSMLEPYVEANFYTVHQVVLQDPANDAAKAASTEGVHIVRYLGQALSMLSRPEFVAICQQLAFEP